MENISQMSLLEVALSIMNNKKAPQNIHTLIREVLEMKGVDDSSYELTTQLYIDITTSSKFVYMGNDEWDLKIRQSLDEFDKDGSAFNSKDELEEDELEAIEDDILELDEEDDDEDDEDDLELDEEDDEEDDLVIEVDSLIDDETEIDDAGNPVERFIEDDDDFDEDEYNDIMDDYEDMY